MTEYYHVSRGHVPVGTPLQCRFFKSGDSRRIFDIVGAAASIGPDALRMLLLTEELMHLKTRALPESSKVVANAYVEHVYEAVRSSKFPTRPSRLESVFLLEDEAASERFRTDYRDGKGAILVCTVESGDLFRADMNLLQPPDIHSPDAGYKKMVAAAEAYWRASMSDDPRPEMLANGRVVVLGQLPQPVGTLH